MADQKSTQLAGADSFVQNLPSSSDVFGKARLIRGTYTVVADDAIGTTVEVARLWRGLKVVPFGKVFHDALGVGATIDVGIESGDVDAFLDGGDVAAAGNVDLDAAAGVGYEPPAGGVGFEAPDGNGTSVIVTFGGADPAVGAVIEVYLAVVQE